MHLQQQHAEHAAFNRHEAPAPNTTKQDAVVDVAALPAAGLSSQVCKLLLNIALVQSVTTNRCDRPYMPAMAMSPRFAGKTPTHAKTMHQLCLWPLMSLYHAWASAVLHQGPSSNKGYGVQAGTTYSVCVLMHYTPPTTSKLACRCASSTASHTSITHATGTK